MRSIATFQSTAFNTAEPRPYFINPGCYGDDLGKWLISRLQAAGVTTDPEPGQEDFGWYFDFAVPEGDHCCVLGFRAADGDDPAVWVLVVERARGLLGSLFLGRKRGIAQSALRVLHSALSGTPEVNSLRWHEPTEFDRGNEASGAPQP